MLKKMISNAYHYVVGNYRYWLYGGENNLLKVILRKTHIEEQFQYRMNSLNKKCYCSGACKGCGCSIPQMTYSNKVCSQVCYPKFLSKKEWEKWKYEEFHSKYWVHAIRKSSGERFKVDLSNMKFIKFEEVENVQ